MTNTALKRHSTVGVTGTTLDVEITYHFPIVFLPGIMGTRLKIQQADSFISWDPDDEDGMRNYLIEKALVDKRRELDAGNSASFFKNMESASSVFDISQLYPAESQQLAMKAGRGERLSLDEQNKMAFFRLDQLDVATDANGFAMNTDVFEAERERLIERGWNEPVWKYYGPMLLALERAQRSHGEDRIRGGNCPVYACGYDWRQSNALSARRLQRRLQTFREREERITGSPPDGFILVTHSMGGLVARSYLEQFADEADEQIAAVVHISQPAHGAPILYRRLKTGVSLTRGDGQMTFVLDQIMLYALDAGESPERTALMVSGFPSVLELLPTTAFRLLERQRDDLLPGLHSWLSWERELLPTDPPNPRDILTPSGGDAPADNTFAKPPKRSREQDYMYVTPDPDRVASMPESGDGASSGTPLTDVDPHLADLFGDAYSDPTGLVGIIPHDLSPRYARQLRQNLADADAFQASIDGVFHPETFWAGSTGHATDTVLVYIDPSRLERAAAALRDSTFPSQLIAQWRAETKVDQVEAETADGRRHVAPMLHYQPEDGDGTVPLASQLGPESEDSPNVCIVEEGPGHAETCGSEALHEQTLDWIQSVIFDRCPPLPEDATDTK